MRVLIKPLGVIVKAHRAIAITEDGHVKKVFVIHGHIVDADHPDLEVVKDDATNTPDFEARMLSNLGITLN